MSTNFQPTAPQNRIELLDVLRGLAIFGVLLSNIVIFSGYVFTPYKDLQTMPFAGINEMINLISFSIIKGKFYPILMLLFGVGLYMQFQKHSKDGFVKFFFWRMLILLLIGLVHQTFWAGDVVTIYALFAILLIPIRKIKIKTYLIISIILFLLHFITGYIQATFMPIAAIEYSERVAQLQFSGLSPAELISIVQNDGFRGLQFVTAKQSEILWNIPRYVRITPSTIMLFLLGAYLYGSGFFTEKAYKLKYTFIFLFIGIIGSYLMFYVNYTFNIIGNVFIALAYVSFIAFLIHKGKGQFLMKTLIPLGRMALTNYIMQSVICITIFYGVGFGLFAKLPLYQVMTIAILILVFQIWFSQFWLKRFQFGPLEMLWRRLSYGKLTKVNSKEKELHSAN